MIRTFLRTLQMNFRHRRVVVGSPVFLALIISLVLLIFHNQRFWRDTAAEFMSGTFQDGVFMVSLFVMLLFLHSAALLVIPGRNALKIVVSFLFIIAALASYSADTYGVLIDRDMVRNLFETDQREAAALLNPRFALYFVGLGLLPAALVWRIHIPKIGIKRQLLERAGFLVLGSILSAGVVYSLAAYYSSFAREHKSLRYLLSPAAAIQGTIQYVRSTMPDKTDQKLVDKDGPVTRTAAAQGKKPLLMFLVVGETARAKNFQLGGYERQTNPKLAKRSDVFYFSNVTSCGTSTAISVPCMFSHLGRENFSVKAAAQTTNLLDTLDKAGIDVEWRDNNSGSKGVSARIKTTVINATFAPDLCNDQSCYDEILLKGLDKDLSDRKKDTVLVFHQMGSHGPAYTKRYPANFERFTPVCQTNELKQCSVEELRNAFDNSILYTDHNLARQIDILSAMADKYDTALLYVSDHGESLGEKGLYLHGAPYVFAPDEQKRVPMILWMSAGYRARFGMNPSCLQAQLSKPFSHDNLYHTVLGAMAIKNDIYQPAMDILQDCRSAHVMLVQTGHTQ